MERSIFLRIIEHGLKFPNGFKYNQFIGGLKLDSWETKIINRYLKGAYLNTYNSTIIGKAGQVETPFILVEYGNSSSFMDPSHTYLISYDANFKYIDFQELKFARETSKEARNFSKIAIIISLAAFFASIFIPIFIAKYFTQTVKIENSQFQILNQGN